MAASGSAVSQSAGPSRCSRSCLGWVLRPVAQGARYTGRHRTSHTAGPCSREQLFSESDVRASSGPRVTGEGPRWHSISGTLSPGGHREALQGGPGTQDPTVLRRWERLSLLRVPCSALGLASDLDRPQHSSTWQCGPQEGDTVTGRGDSRWCRRNWNAPMALCSCPFLPLGTQTQAGRVEGPWHW